MATRRSSNSNSSNLLILIAAVVVVGILIVVLTGRVPRSDPFRMSSTAPDGYGALSLLLEQHGTKTRDISPTELLQEFDETHYESVGLVLPRFSLLHEETVEELLDHVATGATLIAGEVLGAQEAQYGFQFEDMPINPYREIWPTHDHWSFDISPQELIDAEAELVDTLTCDIEELKDLGAIDAFGSDAFSISETSIGCYGSQGWFYVAQGPLLAGTVITVGSPYLFTNARMQPQKEDGGRAFSNATMALRMLGEFDEIWVIGEDTGIIDLNEEESMFDVVPDQAWLTFWCLMVGVVLFVWWKGRRHGAPIEEEQPVEIAGSALVSSIGELRRRKGNASQAAKALRVELRRDLGLRIGLPPNAAVAALIDAISRQTTMPKEELIQTLCFPDESVVVGNQMIHGAHISDAESLVKLTNKLHQIRTEVLHVSTT